MGLDEAAVAALRAEFPALQQTVNNKPIVFFDGPGGTQVHGSVIRAMGAYLLQSNSNTHGAFHHSRRTDEETYHARCVLADFLNASRPEEIVFGPNMTTLTFTMSRAIGETLAPGDEIVVTRLDHDANIAPWAALRARGVVIRQVDFDPADCTLDMAGMESILNDRTKLIAVGYASNSVGTINDVRRIADLAHEVGARVYVDAVHYAPHGPIDVQEIRCDFLVCSAYKFFGPHLGILYGEYGLLDSLPAFKVRPAGDLPPDKFETGTSSFEAVSGAAAAVAYLGALGREFGKDSFDQYAGFEDRKRHLKAAMAVIRAYEKELCRRLVAGLGQIPGLTIYGITDPARSDERVPTVSFTFQGLSPREVADRLDKENIFVWDGDFYAPAVIEHLGLETRGGLVRVGLCHYNTPEEVGTLIDALSKLEA